MAYSPDSKVPYGCPRSTTWDRRSEPGLSSTGFIAEVGFDAGGLRLQELRPPDLARRRRRPAELLDMFCALNGATPMPRRASARHSPVTTSDLPASEDVPATSSPLARLGRLSTGRV